MFKMKNETPKGVCGTSKAAGAGQKARGAINGRLVANHRHQDAESDNGV